MRIGLLHTTVREEEKLILKEAKSQNLTIDMLDIRSMVLNPSLKQQKYDLFLERCISTTIGAHAVMFFESLGSVVVNSSVIAVRCENKFQTSLMLQKHKVPTIPFVVAFTEEDALRAVEQLGGYPVVVKPVSGSWGRLLAKVNDQDGLEAVIEQKLVLGSPVQKILYIQKYMDKKKRDIRVMVVGGEVLCAIYRESNHWITNTARGAVASVCKVNKELRCISLDAAKSVGGGILGIDVIESEQGYLVNEINHTPEFKNVQRVTGINVASAILSYCKEVAAL